MTASTYQRPVDSPSGTPATAPRSIAELAAGLSLSDLPARDLSESELLELAASVAAAPESWRRDVAFDDERRHYVCLYRDAHVDIWLLCWTPRNDTGWHDHDISSGAVAVVEGRLVEHVLAVGVASIATAVEAGQAFSFAPDHIHRLTGLDPQSVTVHTYSPPLWRMGQYAVTASGVLRRTSVSYADELRPIDGSPATGGPA
jgi:hypothetical protein